MHGTMSALRRTLQAEFPEVKCRVVDLDAAADPVEAAADLAAELARSDEPEVAFRGRLRFAPRLAPASLRDPVAAEDQFVELIPAASELIHELALVRKKRTVPKPDEVEIEVRATGLNFRDVLNALGMLPGTAHRLGGECAGVIARAGSDTTFSVGDPVMAFPPRSVRFLRDRPTRYVARKPECLDFTQAAGLPIAYLTALLRCTDRVLATWRNGPHPCCRGRTGFGCAEPRSREGRSVFATAGSEVKRDYVRAQGATAVISSRDRVSPMLCSQQPPAAASTWF